MKIVLDTAVKRVSPRLVAARIRFLGTLYSKEQCTPGTTSYEQPAGASRTSPFLAADVCNTLVRVQLDFDREENQYSGL